MMHRIDSFNVGEKKKLTLKPHIDPTAVIKACSFGEYVEIGAHNTITESTIDSFSYTSEQCQIIYSEIAKFVNIASFVRLNPGQHPKERVCQHHMLYRREMFGFGEDDQEFFAWRRANRVTIGNDVWIGHNVTIMGGISVGDGAIIGSGAIVTKDIPPYAIAVGNPARVINYRFDEKQIDALQQIKWWQWEYEKIKSSLDEFRDISAFIEKYGK
jgi:phosphonate metabolism protein (transferase hexapeptide repeat family)